MFIHARTFETRWGLALAHIMNDDDYYSEVLALRVWAPLCDDGSLAMAEIKIGIRDEVGDAAADAMEEANRSAIKNMDAAKFEAAMEKGGVAFMLDKAFERHPQ